MWLLLTDFGVNTSPIPDSDDNALLEREQHLRVWEEKLLSAERQLAKLYPHQSVTLLRQNEDTELTKIYVITPTYARPVQKAELTRLKNTLLHVASLHWILVEDAQSRSQLVTRFLRESGLSYTHLCVATPADYKLQSTDPSWLRPRGVLQRNAGLAWLRQHLEITAAPAGVVYFADDDNTYDLKIFDEMRATERVSVWPVGLAGYLRYESPVLGNDGHVIGWFTAWKPKRKFALDMAGFAVNTGLLMAHAAAEFSYAVSRGEQENFFLSQMVSLTDLEPRADNCTQVLVWHTRTEPANLKNEEKLRRRGLQGSDPNVEV